MKLPPFVPDLPPAFAVLPVKCGDQWLATILDEADAPAVAPRRWCAIHNTKERQSQRHKYAYANIDGAGESLHRHILGLTKGDGKVVDHLNGDSLDNRRSNLQVVTNSINQQRRRVNWNNRLGVRGVSFRYGKFYARAWSNGHRHEVGPFTTLADATKAAEALRARVHVASSESEAA